MIPERLDATFAALADPTRRAILARLAADPPPDTLLLVTTGRAAGETYSTAWFKAFEKHGVVVQSWPVETIPRPGMTKR